MEQVIKINRVKLNGFQNTYQFDGIGSFIDLKYLLMGINGVEIEESDENCVIKFNSLQLLKNQKRFAGRKSKKNVSNDELKRLVKKYGYDEVSEILGVSVSTVRRWLEQELDEGESMPKKQNRKYNPKKYDIDVSTLIEEKKSHTYRELAEKYGCSESHLRNMVFKLKKDNND